MKKETRVTLVKPRTRHSVVRGVGTLLAFRLAEGIFATGHSVLKYACKNIERSMKG